MKSLINTISKLTLALAMTYAVNQTAVSQATTQKVDIDSLCRQFPLNSLCQDRDLTKSTINRD